MQNGVYSRIQPRSTATPVNSKDADILALHREGELLLPVSALHRIVAASPPRRYSRRSPSSGGQLPSPGRSYSFPSANHAENLLLSQSQPPTQSHNVVAEHHPSMSSPTTDTVDIARSTGRGAPPSTAAAHFFTVALRFPIYLSTAEAAAEQRGTTDRSHGTGQGWDMPLADCSNLTPLCKSSNASRNQQRVVRHLRCACTVGTAQLIRLSIVQDASHKPSPRHYSAAMSCRSRQQLESSCLREAPTTAGASACFAAQSRESSRPLRRVAMTLSRLIDVHAMRLAARGSGYPHSLPAKGSKLSLPVAHISSLPHTQPPIPTMGG
ncbi:hypothetical protein K456DRAFT_40907 [Colletotrichum gloeosporioides 23]|nr:hypothetical protein K456DRAFT_40907 [Colletotrichum gloeosporioides 23]